MTKKKKLAKKALKHPDLFSFGELAFFQRWLQERKALKAKKEENLSEVFKEGEPNPD